MVNDPVPEVGCEDFARLRLRHHETHDWGRTVFFRSQIAVQFKKIFAQMGFKPCLMNTGAFSEPTFPVGLGDIIKSGPGVESHDSVNLHRPI